MRTLALTLLGAYLLIAPAAHADEAVILKSGEVVGGKIVSLDDTNLVMDVNRGAGKRERLTIRVADLTPGSHYTVRAARVPDGDGAAHLALAEWCLASDLAYFAMQEYAKAKQADASLAAKADAGIKRAKLARGRHFYTRAVNAMQARNYVEAKRLFGIVIKHYPTPFGGAASKAMDFVDQQIAARKRAPRVAPGGQAGNLAGGGGNLGGGGGQQPPKKGGGKMGAPPSGVDARTQATLNRLARQIRGLSQEGYFAKTDSRARRNWRDASVVVDQALLLLDRHHHARKIDDETHARLRKPFVDQGTDLGISLAVIALRRDNEYAAQKWLARVLLLDPDNERAKELRTYIVTEFRDRNRRRAGKPYLR